MIVGIDLGTTNSLIGAWTEQGPVLFPNSLGDFLTPSVVSVDDTGTMLVGQGARDRLVTHPQHTVAAFKRWMGSARETRLGSRCFRPEELSAFVLRSLVSDAEAALGEKISEAVVSVPAYFSDAQRKATRAAGALAGIRVERLINEPTAAALAYGLQERREGGRFLVFDLGGGTFDVTILELFEGVVEVHASAGDNFLGGEDFLGVLVEACAADMKFNPNALAPNELGQLRHKLEKVKRDLSSNASARLEIGLGGTAREWEISDERFTRLADPLVQRLRAPLERAMRDASLQPAQLDEIVLVGGASRMPLVARTVSRVFGRLPLRHVNPDRAIALGAAIASGLKARDTRLEEVILTDVCPYTLGTAVTRLGPDNERQEGFFHPIIQRNSTVPVSREDTFWPIHDTQREIVIDVYQGESPMAAKNIKLGEVRLPLARGKRREENSVRVRFTYDINGILLVEVTADATGRKHELILEQNPGLLSPAEIRTRLAALEQIKMHPRDKQENLALIARAERVYEERLADRDAIAQLLAEFRGALESQDAKKIAEHLRRFNAALEQIENT